MKPLTPLSLLLALAWANAVPAQPTAPRKGDPHGDPQAGQTIASKGAANGVTACLSCHGAQGEGNAAANFPRLAAQSAVYLGKQMHSFADGSRNNPVMSPIAKAMNAQQIADVSAWYASIATAPPSAPSPPRKPGDPRQLRGQKLATVGDEAIGVQACINCHGPGGTGEAPTYPYLAGQHAGYLSAAMGEWKSGARKNDPSGQMTQIARKLGDADVAALSAWFAAQPAQASALRVNLPAGSTARPAVAARNDAPGPKGTAAAPGQGVGTEQGSPLTGGNQGQGGGGSTQGTNPATGTGAGAGAGAKDQAPQQDKKQKEAPPGKK